MARELLAAPAVQRVEHDLIPELVAERLESILDLLRDVLGVELVPRDAVARVTPLPRQVWTSRAAIR